MILIDDKILKIMNSLTEYLTFNVDARRGFINITVNGEAKKVPYYDV